MGELVGRGPERAEGVEGALVQVPALTTEQRALDGVANERMAEGEPLVAGLHQQVALDQAPQHVDQFVFVEPGHLAEHLEPAGGADRGDVDHLALDRLEPVELAAYHLLQ